jgi:hypothetical protein
MCPTIFISCSYNLFSVIAHQFQKHYSESREIDTISRVHGELDELKNIMVKNIGEHVTELLLYKFISSPSKSNPR